MYLAGLLTDVRLSIVIGSVLFMLTFLWRGSRRGRFCQQALYHKFHSGRANADQGAVCARSVYVPAAEDLADPAFGISGSCLCSCADFFFFKKLIPWFSFSRKTLSLQTSKVLFSVGAWSSVNQIGVLLFLQIDLMTANLVLGPSEAGVYAAIIQFPLLLRSLAGTLASLFALGFDFLLFKRRYGRSPVLRQ